MCIVFTNDRITFKFIDSLCFWLKKKSLHFDLAILKVGQSEIKFFAIHLSSN